MRVPPDPLKPFQWKARVLVVSTPTASDTMFEEQHLRLAADVDGQVDRELLVLRLIGDTHADVDAVALRERLSMAPDRFEVVLVGKDGTIALRCNRPLELSELFARIDAMPMRREDLRKREAESSD